MMKPIWRSSLLYGLPGLPLAMLGLPMYVYLPSFYTQTLGLSLSVVGVALLLARALDVLTDPLMGWLNDRVQVGAWRRKLFMLLGMPLLLVGVEFLLRPAAEVNGFYLFIWSVLAYLGWTLISVPWQAWGAELSRDYHSKSTLVAGREVFSLLGVVTVIVLPVLMQTGDASRETLALVANILWVLLPLCLLPALVYLPEPQQPLAQAGARLKLSAIAGLFKAQPAVRYLLPAYFINSLANALPATLFLIFVAQTLQVAEQQVGLLLMLYFLSGVLGLPAWLWLAKRVDKSRAWCWALLVSIVAFAGVPFLQAGDVYAFAVICVLSGLALGADITFPASMQGDIAQSMAQQGQSNTGLLFGLWGLLTKLALALAVGLAFPLLDSVGFEQSAAQQAVQQPPQALWMLSFLYGGLPVLLKLWVLWRMWRFPFSKVDFKTVEVMDAQTVSVARTERTSSGV